MNHPNMFEHEKKQMKRIRDNSYDFWCGRYFESFIHVLFMGEGYATSPMNNTWLDVSNHINAS